MLLPLLALCVWVVVVAVPITPLYFQLREEAKTAKDKTVKAGDFQYTVTRDQYLSYSLGQAMAGRSQIIVAINPPGNVVETLLSLPTSWPKMYHPEGMEMETWQALMLPLFCLPFWWFAGRGLDALIGRRRMHWSLFLLGTLLFAGAVLLSAGAMLSMGSVSPDDNPWLPWGVLGWALLLAWMPIGWIVQSRRSRAQRRADVIPLSS